MMMKMLNDNKIPVEARSFLNIAKVNVGKKVTDDMKILESALGYFLAKYGVNSEIKS